MLQELPFKSKLAAAEHLGLKTRNYISEDSIILYLGASSGTTITYLNLVYRKAKVFAIDLAPLMLKKIVLDSINNKLQNVIPILADANLPEKYYYDVLPIVDLIYQDIAQKNQYEIFEKNSNLFLKKKGYGFVAVKARSIDTTKSPQIIFKEFENQLQNKFKIIEKYNISQFQKDHMFYVVQKL